MAEEPEEYEDEEIDLRTALAGEEKGRYGDGTRSSFEDTGGGEGSEAEDEDLRMSRGNAISQNYDYSQLNVSAELKELFTMIERFKPADVELDTKLKPFIPEYIPAVGDIDAFIKVPRPDGKPDNLGLVVLDEPSSRQTDPSVLELQWRQQTKQTVQAVTVRGIENADKNPKAIVSWVESISELHKSKGSTNVAYTKRFPDVETLMQEWPQEVEKLLDSMQVPGAEIDMDLRTYVKTACSLLDIPVYNNIIESLHVLFSLYTAFKENQHFQGQAAGGPQQPIDGTNYLSIGGEDGLP